MCPNRCPVLMDTCYSQNVASSVPHNADMNFAPVQLFQLTLDAGHVLTERIKQFSHTHHFLYNEMTSCQV